MHYRRGRPKTRQARRSYNERRIKEKSPGDFGRWLWLGLWPRWHDIVFHRRPLRRAEQQVSVKIMNGFLDPEEAIWPVGGHKPHRYYW